MQEWVDSVNRSRLPTGWSQTEATPSPFLPLAQPLVLVEPRDTTNSATLEPL